MTGIIFAFIDRKIIFETVDWTMDISTIWFDWLFTLIYSSIIFTLISSLLLPIVMLLITVEIVAQLSLKVEWKFVSIDILYFYFYFPKGDKNVFSFLFVSLLFFVMIFTIVCGILLYLFCAFDITLLGILIDILRLL